MRNKGFAEGPFQLLIGIVVFGMALVIGAYLFNMINCWRCEELMKIEATELKEAISSVGKGDVNSQKSDVVKLGGYCADGIYIVKITGPCQSFCPNHPNSCWAIRAKSRCSGGDILYDCIDVSGSLDIRAESNDNPGETVDWPEINGQPSYPITATTTNLKIEKIGPGELLISGPPLVVAPSL